MDPFSHSPHPAKSDGSLHFPAVTARTRTLPNGLGIIVQEDHSAPVASVQVWVQTGSIHEEQHLGAGLSHLLEHMLFKGTKTRGASEFAQRIQDSGGYINAYTSFDRTVYWIDIPAKGVSTALELLSDAVLNSTLPADELEKEREVIRREFAMGADDPDRVSSHALFATAYVAHPYQYPIIGHLDVFDQIEREDLVAYYQRRYIPNNMFFVVVGDVDAAAVEKQLAEIFAPYPRRSLPPIFLPPEPPQLGPRATHLEFASELTRLSLAWHVPAASHPDIPALDLAATVLGNGRSSRLYKKLREELAIVHSADAWCYAPPGGGLFGMDAMLDPENRELVENAMREVLEDLRTGGVSERELQKAKKTSLGHQLQAVTTMRGRASDLGSNWLISRNLDLSRDYLAAIQKVTLADLQRVFATYFTDRTLSTVSVNPVGALAALPASAAVPVAGPIQKFTLSNGLRLLVREDPRLPLVSLTASFKAGLLVENAVNNGITRLFSKVLLKGTKTRTAEQIADAIEELGGSLSTDAGNNSLSISARLMQPDLHAGMEILADILRHASLPEKAIAREKEAQFAALKAEEEELTVVARHLLRAELFGNHPYGLRSAGTIASVSGISQEDLRAFQEKYVVGSNGVLAVFGDVQAAEVLALAEIAFADLPAGAPALASVPEPPLLTRSVEVETLKPKEQAILMVGFPGVDLFSPDHAALELIDEACSDLGSRLFLRIRDQMGLAYFVGSSHIAGLARGMFAFYLGTAPEKLADVKIALFEEIAKLADQGLTSEEVARAKEKSIGQQEIRNQSNHSFSYQAALNELYGLGHSHHLDLRAEIEALTCEQIREVAARYFQKPCVAAIVRPGDEKALTELA